MKITKTKLAIKVSCKCGSCVAATMIYGGVEIDAEFMDTVAKYANNDGKIELVDTDKYLIKLSSCTCNKNI